MIILNTTIPTKLFDFDRQEMTFTAELSTIMGNGHDPFSRIYDDAIDAGLALISPRGNVIVYAHVSTERDPEGETMYWEFEPIPEHKAKAGCTKVVLFND